MLKLHEMFIFYNNKKKLILHTFNVNIKQKNLKKYILHCTFMYNKKS